MRPSVAVALIAVAALVPWLWFHPGAPPSDLPARLVSVTAVATDDARIGGLSGLELSEDGTRFVAVTDKGHVVRGRVSREAGEIVEVSPEDIRPFVDKTGKVRDSPHTDAEGLALDDTGRIYVSFEQAHRVLFYDRPDDPAQWPSYTRAWRALPGNKGLEALALASDGTLYAVAEETDATVSETAVYSRAQGQKWQQNRMLPIDAGYAPVGADFGPDGRLYLLERGLYPFGFYSRVRAMQMTPDGARDIETVLQTPLGRHGNLEGLSVWRDPSGNIRLTLVSDDNFYFFMRSEIVEYVLHEELAHP